MTESEPRPPGLNTRAAGRLGAVTRLATSVGWRDRARRHLDHADPAHRAVLVMLVVDRAAWPTRAEHQAGGDAVVIAVEAALRRTGHPGGVPGWLHGGIVVYLFTVTGPRAARQAVDHLAADLARHLQPAATSRRAAASSPSIGAGLAGSTRPDLTTLFWAADAALYRATLDGRVVVATG